MELLQNENDPETLFFSSIKSEATKNAYVVYLRKYVQTMNFKSIDDLLSVKDNKQIENLVINFIIKMKEAGMNYRAISNYITPVISFYKINDIMLNSKKINKFMPPQTRAKKNRGYSYEEIKNLLDIADERLRVVILLLASCGCRIGALPLLHVRDLEKKNNIYKITIYENDREEYFTFCTPECAQAIDAYLDMRKRYGEKIGPDSILIREQFNIRDQFAAISPKPIKVATLCLKISQLAERAGIRERSVLKEGEKPAAFRKTVPRAHGFRKAFSTFALSAKMDIIKRRMLEGHSVGIDEHYCKPSEEDLQEEYMKGVDNLTINPENRLKRKVEKLEVEASQLQRLQAAVTALEQKIK